MNILQIINILLIIALIYFVFIHGYLLARRKFKCLRCGKCCRLKVVLTKEDIAKIKKAGYKNFLEKNNYLKKVNGYCIFMTLNNGVTSCKLEHSAKPEVCRNFPTIKGFFGKKYDFRCRSFWQFNKKLE